MSNAIRVIIKKELANFEKKICLIIVDAEKYEETKNEIITTLVGSLNLRGIYVSLNEPCTLLYAKLTEKIMDSEKLLIIDGVCKELGVKNAKNCVQLTNAGSLTELSLAINDALNTKLFKFIFFDSFAMLLLYNSLKTTGKFSHYLMNKLKLSNVNGVLMCVDAENAKKIIPFLSGLCDKTIKI